MSQLRLLASLLSGASLLLGALPCGADPQLTRVEVSFLAKSPSGHPVQGTVAFRETDGGGEPIRRAVASPANFSLMLPAASQWEVTADLPGYWVARKSLAVGAPGQTSQLTLDLWPLGTISGIVKLKGRGAPVPQQVLVRTLAVPSFLKRAVAPQGAKDCPVDRRGNWSCSLPTATFDLAISAEGSAPHYLWNVHVPEGKTLPLGTVELERGASVAGWVTVEDGKIEPSKCIATLDVLTAGGESARDVAKLKRATLQREIRKDGFFQFAGLAAGTYRLAVQQPGYPVTRELPIQVDPGTETFLPQPVALRRPLPLRFEVQPPLDWLGKPWHAQVFRLGERPPVPLVLDGQADEDGRFEVAGQSMGRFRVSLRDSRGNALYSGEHRLDDGSPDPQGIEVHFVTVEGTVRLGENPLPSVLWFGGRSGTTSIQWEADESGRFQGVLPREGLWRIEIDASKPRFSTWTTAEVRSTPAGKARLDVQLPDTRIFGRVVDEQGKSVPGADVAVRGEDLDLLQSTDSAGEFEARGLSAGAVWLGAQASSQISDRTYATLVEGGAVGPLELRLHKTKRLAGTVTSPRGPVMGSRVVILARTPDGGGAATMTDADGAFQVDLPPAASRVVAIVSAPGFALQAYGGQADGTQPLVLQVAEEAGSLEVTLPFAPEDLTRGNLVLAAFQNGLPVPGSVLSQWARDHSQGQEGSPTLRFPGLAPGEYRVCLLPRQLDLLLPWSSVPSGPGCDSGLLGPGSTLSLKPGRP